CLGEDCAPFGGGAFPAACGDQHHHVEELGVRVLVRWPDNTVDDAWLCRRFHRLMYSSQYPDRVLVGPVVQHAQQQVGICPAWDGVEEVALDHCHPVCNACGLEDGR